MLERKLNFDFRTNVQVLNMISQIDHFNGWWSEAGKSENKALKRLKTKSIALNTASSIRMEEIEVSDHETELFLKKGIRNPKAAKAEQLAYGISDVLKSIYEQFDAVPLSEGQLKKWHAEMLAFSTEDLGHRGDFRQVNFQIIAQQPGGGQRTILNATALHAVQQEMGELINWANLKLKEGFIHPLLIAVLFHYEFTSIFPFQFGNGLMARAITHYLLLKAGYPFIQYIPLDHFLELKLKQYRQILFSGQKERFHNQEIISEWTLFFLNTLQQSVGFLKDNFEEETVEDNIYLNERQKDVVQYVKSHQPVKISDISRAMPECSKNTLKKDLQFLQEESLIKKLGERKGTVYVV